jgi:hypothetical protein
MLVYQRVLNMSQPVFLGPGVNLAWRKKSSTIMIAHPPDNYDLDLYLSHLIFRNLPQNRNLAGMYCIYSSIGDTFYIGWYFISYWLSIFIYPYIYKTL